MTNHKIAANGFNHDFIKVAQNLLKLLDDTNNQFQDYFKNPNEHSFFIKEAESYDIFKILSDLKAIEIYGIIPKPIKIAGEALKSHLATLFHQSIKQSIFNDNL